MWAARYWGSRHWAQRYWAPQGLTSPGYYWAERYWAGNYWASSYWNHQSDTNPFTSTVTAGLSLTGAMTLGSMTIDMTNAITATVTSGLTMNGVMGINATPSMEFGNEFIAAAPLELTMAGGLTITATPVLGFVSSAANGYYWAGRYWAAKYWAPRYWQTQIEFEAVVTTGLTLPGSMTVGMTPEQLLVANVLNSLTLTGGLTLESVSIDYPTPPTRHTKPGGLRTRNITYKGKRYYQITNDELAQIIARDLSEIAREDLLVTYRNKKSHKISKEVFEEVVDAASKLPKQDTTDDQDIEDILALL